MQVRIAFIQGSPIVLLFAEDVTRVQSSPLLQTTLDSRSPICTSTEAITPKLIWNALQHLQMVSADEQFLPCSASDLCSHTCIVWQHNYPWGTWNGLRVLSKCVHDEIAVCQDHSKDSSSIVLGQH